MEGLSASRAHKLFPGPIRQRIIAGRGLLSDDTLMAVTTIQAYFAAPDDHDRFSVELGRRLRTWFWTIPPGIGLATVKACLRLSVGVPATRSGVGSAGNGPAIRAVALGCLLAGEAAKRGAFIQASTRVTHTHPLAEAGSQLAGLASALSANGELVRLRTEAAAGWLWAQGYPRTGPTGYIVHTINAAAECWSQDLKMALEMAIRLGGDADSVAAIVGGVVGAAGPSQVPENWTRWMGWPQPADLAAVANGEIAKPPMARLLGQHALELPVILGHGFRRLAPPY